MDWLTSLVLANLIGISSNLDNTGVGIAYGVQHVRIPHWVNAIINLIGFCTALVGALCGSVIGHLVNAQAANVCDCVVLCGIGLFIMYAAYRHPRLSHQQIRIGLRQPGLKQGIGLGLTLSFTNLATGFGATVGGVAALWETAISITVWGYLTIWLGNLVGTGLLAQILGKYSSLLAGLLLVCVGIHQVL